VFGFSIVGAEELEAITLEIYIYIYITILSYWNLFNYQHKELELINWEVKNCYTLSCWDMKNAMRSTER
jgi:hypothetical protein